MKRIAVTMRMIQDPKEFWYDALEENWFPYLYAQGVQPILVPNLPESCVTYLADVDAIILTGGHTPLNPEEKNIDILKRRDKTEHKLVEYARKKSIPILGICRGMEFLNVYFGGTLKKSAHPSALDHDIIITDVSIQSLFPRGKLSVNSFHGWGIDTIGKGLIPLAIAADGLIEGFVHNKEKIMGVLWHPERKFSDPKSQKFHEHLVSKFLSLIPSP